MRNFRLLDRLLQPWEHWHTSPYLLPLAFSVKLLSGIVLGLIYRDFYGGGDTWTLFQDGCTLSAYARENPGGYLNFLWQGHWLIDQDIYSQLSDPNARAVFMAKIISLANLLTYDQYWLSGAVLSCLSFSGSWVLFKAFRPLFPLPAAIAFLFFPSLVFWASGVMKESISWFCIAWIVWLFIKVMDAPPYKILLYGLAIMVLSLVLLKIKYYYFALLLPACISWYFAELWQRSKGWHPLTTFATTFLGIVLLASFSHPNLHPAYFMYAVTENHHKMAADTSLPENLLHFRQLAPTFRSWAVNLPIALWEGLFRPYLWEAGHFWKKMAALETTLLLLLSGLSLYQLKNGMFRQVWRGYTTTLLALAGYCLPAIILLAFSAPNLGNLVRYKTGYLPFLVFALLAWVSLKKNASPKPESQK
jgi:hypothetical protein